MPNSQGATRSPSHSKRFFLLLLIASGIATVGLWHRGGLLAADPPALGEHPEPALERSLFPAYGSAWEALERFDFAAAEQMGLTDDEKRLLVELRRLVAGQPGHASAGLHRLLNESEDPQVSGAAAKALRQLLMLEGRWAELLRVLQETDAVGEEAEDERYWAQAFSTAPAEEVKLPSGSTTVSSRLSISGVPMVPVVVNGKRFLFWLDTGAGATVLASDVAEDCGVETLSSQARAGKTSTSHRIDYRAALVDELAIGDLVVSNHPVAVVAREDLELGPIRVRGIVGWPLLRQLRVEIDYPRRRTTLTLPKASSEPPSPEQPRNLFWLGYPMVAFGGEGGVPLFFGLDTGARRTGLRDDILSKLPFHVVSAGSSVRGGAGGFESVNKRQVERLELHLADQRLTFEKPSFTGGVKAAVLIRPDGKLGSDVGQLGTMVIDYPQGRFEIVPH